MRVLVCGSREWEDRRPIYAMLDGLNLQSAWAHEPMVVIEGQCPYGGADRIAEDWAQENEVEHLPFPPEIVNGYVQGPARNQRMLEKLLEGHPFEQRYVVAFKDGFQRDGTDMVPRGDGTRAAIPVRARGGTEDMVRRAKAAGVSVYIVSHG